MFLEGPFQISLLCDSVIKASPKLPKTGKKYSENDRENKKIREGKKSTIHSSSGKEEVPVHWNFVLFMLQGLLE